jgi:hypothetical protein
LSCLKACLFICLTEAFFRVKKKYCPVLKEAQF